MEETLRRFGFFGRCVYITCMGSMGVSTQINQDDQAAPEVNVLEKDGRWFIEGLKTRV